MAVIAKLQKILSFHLKELKDSTWQGDYDDIVKQHLLMFKDIFENDNFHLPTKACIGKCILEVFPCTEQVLRDKTRDCILNVMRYIQLKLRSSTSGKKLTSSMKELMSSYKENQLVRGGCSVSASKTNGQDSVIPKTEGSNSMTPRTQQQKEMLRKFGLGTPSPQRRMQLPIELPDTTDLVSSQASSLQEVSSSCNEENEIVELDEVKMAPHLDATKEQKTRC